MISMSNSSGANSSQPAVELKQIRKKRLVAGVAFFGVAVLVAVELYLPQLSVVNLVDLSNNDQFASIARVVQTSADVRQKPDNLDEWFRAETNGNVVKGDAIYSGINSSADVKMNSGAEIEIQDEVLVIFDGDNQISIPDQARGMVRLQFEPGAKLSFSGQVSQVSGGKGAQSVGAAILTVKSGAAQISTPEGGFRKFERGEKIELNIKISETKMLKSVPVSRQSLSKARGKSVSPSAVSPVAGFQKPIQAPSLSAPSDSVESDTTQAAVAEANQPAPIIPLPEVQEPVVARPPIPTDAEHNHHHVYLLKELYQRKGKLLLEARSMPKYVRARVNLTWADTPDRKPGQDAVIQVSSSEDFSKPWLEGVSKTANLGHSSWPLGENFWRVSYDKLNWSQPKKVSLSADFDRARRPKIISQQSELSLPNAGPSRRNSRTVKVSADLEFRENGKVPPIAWVLHAADKEDFHPLATKMILVSGRKIKIPLKRIGRFYFRVQGVNKDGQLSGYSPTKVVSVVAPKIPKPEPVMLRAVAAADEEALALKEEALRREAALKEEALKQDEALREESLRREAKAKSAAERKERKAMAVRLEQERVANLEKHYTNRNRYWHIGLETGLFGAAVEGGASAAGTSSTSPSAGPIVGFTGGFDDGRKSARVSYRKESVVDRQSVSGDDLAASRLDLRFESWLKFTDSIFKRPMRYGLLGGYSHYRIPRTTQVTQPFDLFKMGFALEFEVGEKWRTGGDFIIGKWIDSNQTFEANGFLNYDYSKVFGVGLGYRLNIYDAGSGSDAGLGSPYRGIVGEAYSGFRYSF